MGANEAMKTPTRWLEQESPSPTHPSASVRRGELAYCRLAQRFLRPLNKLSTNFLRRIYLLSSLTKAV
jgi:hypothetical protein